MELVKDYMYTVSHGSPLPLFHDIFNMKKCHCIASNKCRYSFGVNSD